MRLDQAEFHERFADTPISRAKREGFLRNVAVALGNWADQRAVPSLTASLDDEAPLVRGHAAWSLGRIGGTEARAALKGRLEQEKDDWVKEEIGLALRSEAT
jgi:epoxyqueuosine reductase